MKFYDEEEVSLNALENLKLFNKKLKTQRAVMQLIQNSLITEKEQEELRMIFQSIDQNFDYKLTKSEFVQGLQKMGLADAEQW